MDTEQWHIGFFIIFFRCDALYLVEKGNIRLGKSILKAIDSFSNANHNKSAVCFNLNECDFPPLPSLETGSKPLHSPVKCVGRKSVCKPVRKPVPRFLNPLLKLMNLSVQLSYLLVLYPSKGLRVRCINLL